MLISSERLIEILREVFPECDDMAMSQETQLGELPEWDSMAAVNLQTSILQQYQIEVPLELLGDQTTVEEVIEFLQNPVPSEAAC
jgi:acyl carrier protein